MRARRLDPVRARRDELGRGRLGEAALDLRHARADAVAGQPAPDEDDEAVRARDAVAAVGERVDVELELLPSLDRWRHRSCRVTTNAWTTTWQSCGCACAGWRGWPASTTPSRPSWTAARRSSRRTGDPAALAKLDRIAFPLDAERLSGLTGIEPGPHAGWTWVDAWQQELPAAEGLQRLAVALRRAWVAVR